ncbi:VUT family protein [Streptomyces sp. NPDC029006]|uniref:VUT family protein n=1 Tax=Streptomyces sp. NPDC029006 TaxID=3155467 RepID=UPI0033F7925A
MNLRATTTLATYIATIPAANILVTHYGAVPVGFGLMAPAGVFTIGLALVLRDIAHELTNRTTVWAAIGTGSLLSYLLGTTAVAELVQGTVWANLTTAPRIAMASAASFLLAETSDLLVYSRLRRNGFLPALLASNAVGLVIDSLLFLWLAFDSLTFLWGQVVAKTEMTLLAAVVLSGWVAYRHAHNPADVEACGCGTAERALCGHCAHDRCEDCGTCIGAGHGEHQCAALIGRA